MLQLAHRTHLRLARRCPLPSLKRTSHASRIVRLAARQSNSCLVSSEAFEMMVRHDPELGLCFVLTKQRDPVDRKCAEVYSGKSLLQQLKDGSLALGGKPAGERHMKLKISHHIGISPAIEVIDLSSRQP